MCQGALSKQKVKHVIWVSIVLDAVKKCGTLFLWQTYPEVVPYVDVCVKMMGLYLRLCNPCHFTSAFWFVFLHWLSFALSMHGLHFLYSILAQDPTEYTPPLAVELLAMGGRGFVSKILARGGAIGDTILCEINTM